MTSPIRKAVQGKRPVRIAHGRRTFFVSYLDRVKHGHYNAAQFSEDMKTLAEVEAWVRAQPNLELQS